MAQNYHTLSGATQYQASCGMLGKRRLMNDLPRLTTEHINEQQPNPLNAESPGGRQSQAQHLTYGSHCPGGATIRQLQCETGGPATHSECSDRPNIHGQDDILSL